MKLTANSKILLDALNKVKAAVGSSSFLPVLENLRFDVLKDKITITATDLEISIITKIDCECQDEFSFLVPFRTLIDFIKTIANQPITLQLDGKNLVILTDSIKSGIMTEDIKDFPTIKTVEEEPSKIEYSDLLEINTLVVPFIGTEEKNIRFTGVYLADEAVATNGLTLAKKTLDFNLGGILVPRKAFDCIASFIEGEIEVSTDKTNIQFKQGDTIFVSRLLDEKYVDYKSILPTEYQMEITLDRLHLISIINSANVFTENDVRVIKMTINGELVSIEAYNVGNWKKFEAKLTAVDSNIESLSIGLHITYLLLNLKLIKSKEITLKFNGYNKIIGIFSDDLTYSNLLFPFLIQKPVTA